MFSFLAILNIKKSEGKNNIDALNCFFFSIAPCKVIALYLCFFIFGIRSLLCCLNNFITVFEESIGVAL